MYAHDVVVVDLIFNLLYVDPDGWMRYNCNYIQCNCGDLI